MFYDHLSMNLVLIFLISFFPAVLWVTIFYFRDPKKEPRRWLALSFLSGCLAVLPVLGFSALWKIFTGSEWVEWINSFTSYTTLTSFLSIFWLAILEEFFKHTAVLNAGNEVQMKFDEFSDSLIYSITAAVGFAFLENTTYLWTIFGVTGLGPEFWQVFVFRGLGTMAGHIVFSGVFGFFWGVAIMVLMTKDRNFRHDEKRVMRRFYEKFFFSSNPEKSHLRKLWETVSLYTIRTYLFRTRIPAHHLSPNSMVAEGFWLAVILHTLFNVLVSIRWDGRSLMFLTVPLLSMGLLFLLHQVTGLGKLVAMDQKLPKNPTD